MVMPSIVSTDRSLFAPSDDHAIFMISLNSISYFTTEVTENTELQRNFVGRAENFASNAMRQHAFIEINQKFNLEAA
jgi:hypothetical protein